MRRAGLTAAAASALVAACNLGDDSSFGGFGGGPRSFMDAGTAATPPGPCDNARTGASCSDSQLVCEQQDGPNPACNPHVRCNVYAWQLEPPEKLLCASDCPSAYVEDLPDGCAAANAGTLMCAYPEGTCGCAPVLPDALDGGADGGQDGDDADESDAGDVDAAPRVYTWKCVTPEVGCPRTRPSAGAPCVRPLVCDYGDCLFEDGVTMHCYSGRWTVQRQACDR
ncbi:MAG: hypothetical protein KF764_20680 [Labilithrix sp.]|nr:hypothetical protein [Labilithrix sp.]MBX3225029.1 hypothetical protein [Labilithrix sp.]